MKETLQNTAIKAGPIQHLTDARYFSAYGIDWLSFSFDQNSEAYIAPDLALQIKNWLSGPKIVGQFTGGDWNNITEIINFVGLEAIQIEVEELSSALESLPQGLQLFVEVALSQSPPEALKTASDILIQLNVGDEETWWKRPEWEQWKNFHNRLIINGKIIPESVEEIVSSVNPYGINLSGGSEQKTGVKDYENLDSILELFRGEF